ncbi:MAG: alanine--tRNA ligase, partial [Alphaproteobacteria bacterium]|nr:alanine--tRNA ligase [Alphaproteobacteria bacterium]
NRKFMLFSVSDIRSEFIKYFVENGHKHLDSSSLIPDNDPTLLFTNAGMVQFKDTFTGKKTLPFKRATTSQKCLRAGGKHNDLENVGYTARHHTFFEMLGNFSFGDYFKEQVIEFAWNLVTKRFGLPKEKLLVTVHSSDEEAASFWKKISGLENSKIIRIPTNDNFWSMGDTGPCGPCSEIFYDHGNKIQGGPPGSADEDGDRFIEIWNLVFMQYETLKNGSRINLPKPSIDTGMGLERIAAVLQGVHNNYDIDLFQSIINDIKSLTGKDSPEFDANNRVIADHIRAISFMISDGLIPSNEGRGYVLRRIIRRALRHGYMMGMKEPFLYKLVSSVKNVMGDYYKELISNELTIKQIVKNEEEGFMKTIDKGMFILKSELNKLGSSDIFPADVAYKLYDTYGFPFDLTQDILRNEGKHADEKEFDKISAEQKKLSKKAWVGSGDSFTNKIWFDIKEKIEYTEFIRCTRKLNSQILAIIKDSKLVGTTESGENVYIITKETPFYSESGGQIGDIGKIFIDSNIAEVIDTKKIAGLIVHSCVIKAGEFKKNDNVTLEIDYSRRLATSKNHTATHLLQAALRKVLGETVTQKGSLVTNERLRFDFIYNGVITKEQLAEIDSIVINAIDESLSVRTDIMTIDEAKKSGALALFGEKYPNEVRVVTIGDNFSKELCGGEHVSNTSQIGCFKILSISSIGSGIKRIEAITGREIRKYFENENFKLSQKVEKQNDEIKKLTKQILELSSQKFSNSINLKSEKIGKYDFKYTIVNDSDQKSILSIIDKEKSSERTCLIIANKNTSNDKLSMSVFVSKDILSDLTAKSILENINKYLHLNIKFGGRDDLVQCGGIDSENFDKLIEVTKNFLS